MAGVDKWEETALGRWDTTVLAYKKCNFLNSKEMWFIKSEWMTGAIG